MDGRQARYSQAEKAEVIHLVEHSDVSVDQEDARIAGYCAQHLQSLVSHIPRRWI